VNKDFHNRQITFIIPRLIYVVTIRMLRSWNARNQNKK